MFVTAVKKGSGDTVAQYEKTWKTAKSRKEGDRCLPLLLCSRNSGAAHLSYTNFLLQYGQNRKISLQSGQHVTAFLMIGAGGSWMEERLKIGCVSPCVLTVFFSTSRYLRILLTIAQNAGFFGMRMRTRRCSITVDQHRTNSPEGTLHGSNTSVYGKDKIGDTNLYIFDFSNLFWKRSSVSMNFMSDCSPTMRCHAS